MQATGTDDASANVAKTAPQNAQGNQQQSAGSEQVSTARIGPDTSGGKLPITKMPTCVSARQIKGFAAHRQSAAPTDLMPGDSPANMLETRAVGAVG